MEIFHLSYPSLREKPTKPNVFAIGYFDGVHIGHQKIIETANRLAQKNQALSTVFTFDPHPKEVLKKEKSLSYITSLEEKINIFEKMGVQQVYILRFDLGLAQLSAKQFVENILLRLNVKGVVTGFNFRFGKNQSGESSDLHLLSQGRFQTEIVDLMRKNTSNVSSTWIRHLLAVGEMALVRELLGRYYQFRGIVVHGEQRGQKMGFPTANLSLSFPYTIPSRGVYIVKVTYDGVQAYGLMNIGIRPTFKQNVAYERIEVHLLNCNENLYGKELCVEVMHYLRPEQKFPSLDALVAQIKRDQKQAEEWLSTCNILLK